MPDTNNGSNNGQAPDGTTGQAPTQPNGQAPGGTSQNSNQQNNNNSNSQSQGQTGQNQGQRTPADMEAEITRLRQEAASYRVKATELENQQRQADENKLAAEKQFEQLANKRAETIKELEAKIAGFERKETINQILAAHKLPLDLAVAITGTTKEEMEASAKILAKHVVAPPAPNTEGGQNQQKKSSQGTGQGQGQGHGQQNQSQRRYGFQAPNEVSWPI